MPRKLHAGLSCRNLCLDGTRALAHTWSQRPACSLSIPRWIFADDNMALVIRISRFARQIEHVQTHCLLQQRGSAPWLPRPSVPYSAPQYQLSTGLRASAVPTSAGGTASGLMPTIAAPVVPVSGEVGQGEGEGEGEGTPSPPAPCPYKRAAARWSC